MRGAAWPSQGFGTPLALLTGFGGGVQQFGHRTAGVPAGGGAGFAPEPALQLHLDLGALALGNPVEERVLAARGQILDPSGQLAGVVFRLDQGWARLGCDREQAGVEAQEVGQRPLGCGEGSQAGGDWWFEVAFFVVAEGVLVAFPGSVARSRAAGRYLRAPGSASRHQPNNSSTSGVGGGTLASP